MPPKPPDPELVLCQTVPFLREQVNEVLQEWFGEEIAAEPLADIVHEYADTKEQEEQQILIVSRCRCCLSWTWIAERDWLIIGSPNQRCYTLLVFVLLVLPSVLLTRAVCTKPYHFDMVSLLYLTSLWTCQTLLFILFDYYAHTFVMYDTNTALFTVWPRFRLQEHQVDARVVSFETRCNDRDDGAHNRLCLQLTDTEEIEVASGYDYRDSDALVHARMWLENIQDKAISCGDAPELDLDMKSAQAKYRWSVLLVFLLLLAASTALGFVEYLKQRNLVLDRDKTCLIVESNIEGRCAQGSWARLKVRVLECGSDDGDDGGARLWSMSKMCKKTTGGRFKVGKRHACVQKRDDCEEQPQFQRKTTSDFTDIIIACVCFQMAYFVLGVLFWSCA